MKGIGILRRVVPIMLALFLCEGTGWAQGRIATVDLRKIFDGYWKTKQADAALKDRQADLEKDLKDLVAEQKKAGDDYQTALADADNQALSQEERDKRKRVAEDKLKQMKDAEDQITKYRRSALVRLDEQSKRMRDNILSEIRNVVRDKAKTAGYSLVIDTAADTPNNTPVILFTNNENDITDSVLSQLNASAPVEIKPEDTSSDAKGGKKKDDSK